MPWEALHLQRLGPSLASQLLKLTDAQLPSILPTLASWQESITDSLMEMGRRDARTRKGKIFKGSSGNVRPRLDVSRSVTATVDLLSKAIGMHRLERKSRKHHLCSGNGNRMK